MGKDTNRAYKVVPVDEDEPDFGDPPRNWGRVASMASVWAVVLLGSAWMAPGFASGGDEGETDARDQPPTTPRQAAARYLEAGLDDDSDRADEVLCDDASPEVRSSELVALRDEYDELLGSYPEVEVSTSEPVVSDSGMEVATQVSFIGDSIYYEDFTVTVLATGDSYCVDQVVRSEPEEEETGTAVDPQELAAKYLSAVFVVRDFASASGYQCAEYDGPKPVELGDALSEWEALSGEATAIQSFDGDPAPSSTQTVVPMSVELSSNRAIESFSFEVTVKGDCVSALSGGEALLNAADD